MENALLDFDDFEPLVFSLAASSENSTSSSSKFSLCSAKAETVRPNIKQGEIHISVSLLDKAVGIT